MIPVAAYPMNVCKFNNGELNQLDQVIKKELHAKNMLTLVRQVSDERLKMRKRWKRTEVSERRIQGDQAARHMPYVKINESVDKISLEERATERRKYRHSRMLD